MVEENSILEIQAELAAEITAIRLAEAQRESTEPVLVNIAVVRHTWACGIAAALDRSGRTDGSLGFRTKRLCEQTLTDAGGKNVEEFSHLYFGYTTNLGLLPKDTPGLIERRNSQFLIPEEFITGILDENYELLQEIVDKPPKSVQV